MTPSLDQPKAVRKGESFDTAALEDWLDGKIDLRSPLGVEQFPAGHSNLTYLLTDADGAEFVLRRPPFGAKIRSGHDMTREHRVLTLLSDFAKAPTALALCEEIDVIGAPFYLMERVAGVIVRSPKAKLDSIQMSALCSAFVDTFVEVHGVEIDGPRWDGFGRPTGYVDRQIQGWTTRYKKAATGEVPDMDTLAKWLDENRPPQSETTLIHNDFKYDNLVLDPEDFGHVRAVLDWEMATIGDPLMDLGSTLGYWVEADDPEFLQAVSGPTSIPGNLTRRELVSAYAERSGRDVSEIVFYYAYGLFKLGVIAQQIYRRFKEGKTQDPRFEGLILVVHAVAKQAVIAIQGNEI